MASIRSQRGGVRRGVSIAAAALSLALVAPAIQPVAGVSFAPQAQAQEAPVAIQDINPGVTTPKQTSKQGTEYYLSDASKIGEYESVYGNAYIDVTGVPTNLDSIDIPLEGKLVFAQWKDYTPVNDGNGRISPVYAGTVKPDGSYSIKLPVWTDEQGKKHEWEATAGQMLRVWMEDFDTEKYQVGFAEFLGQWTGAAQRHRCRSAPEGQVGRPGSSYSRSVQYCPPGEAPGLAHPSGGSVGEIHRYPGLWQR